VWIARYGHAPITAWTLWQFSDHGNVPGATGLVDVDTFSGTLDDLKKLCFGS
jgi:lysozyme